MAIKNSGVEQLIRDEDWSELLQLYRKGIDIVGDAAQLLEDDSAIVRKNAARALSEVAKANAKAIGPVIPRLRHSVMNDKDGEVVREAASAVGASGGLLDTETAMRVLESPLIGDLRMSRQSFEY